ncbi:MAG: hypothetical protein GTN76_04025, partial [Candidatus Aenigmarchaeota archaeon]|nr:hypothetical protein [Candidatus Aenigmarchaeota archaeon]
MDPSGEGWIIGDPVDFLTNVEEIFEQINKEPMGQKLFDRVRDKGKKLKINYKPEDLEFSYKKESLFVGTISDIEKMKGSGKGMAPIVMAHELIHYVHWSESEEAYKKRRGEIVAEWSNEEEYLTIHGHTSKSKTKDDVYENG